jgi:mannitol/fructose-specific phosphotransferase system IIA component (Ntr-type)
MENLSNYLTLKKILLIESAYEKKEVITIALNKLANVEKDIAQYQQKIYQAILNREQKKSTDLGKLTAVPHGKDINLNKIYITFIRINKSIPWDINNENMVNFIFLVIAPEQSKATEYLHILSQISKLISRKETRENLLQANSPQQILNIINNLKERNIPHTSL